MTKRNVKLINDFTLELTKQRRFILTKTFLTVVKSFANSIQTMKNCFFFWNFQIKLSTYLKRFISFFFYNCSYLLVIFLVFFMFARESILVQIKFWLFFYENFKNKYTWRYFNLFHFSKVFLRSFQFSEILSHLSFISGLTEIFLNIFIKVIFKNFDKYFMDNLMKFLVGSSSIQRPYNYLKYLLFG